MSGDNDNVSIETFSAEFLQTKIEELTEQCNECGFAWYPKTEFSTKLVGILSKQFKFVPVDMVGQKVLNEDTDKYYYLNKDQGDCYEVYLK